MIYLCFVWHMHQPYYRDLLESVHYLPWVRLHSCKDYLDMLLLLEEFPQIKITFNLTPVLVEQIKLLEHEEDRYFKISQKEPHLLSDEDKKFILDNFFSINPSTSIVRFPRYWELYKKEKNKFNFQDFLDLQVLFNLVWIDPLFRKKDPVLRELVRKGRFFSQEDKEYILSFHKKILSQIIPSYKEFAHNEIIELTTTPFYHPILPLLISTNSAKDCTPQVKLPKRVFSFPEDAYSQIKEAKDFIQQNFEYSLEGFWPSEEAVSQEVVDFFIKENIKWIITDETILFNSLSKKKIKKEDSLYLPYYIEQNNRRLIVVFRDKYLSDNLSFVYHRMQEKEAIRDFVSYLYNIHKNSQIKNPLVIIGMDGENAWEYYRWDGYFFLRDLLKEVLNLGFVKVTTVKESLKELKAIPLTHLSTGSWIGGNLLKWIGSPLKNFAWDLLTEARDLLEKKKNLDSVDLKTAYKQIHILEGSDWFWWEDEDNSDVFDFLFRLHLKNFYRIIGEKIPEILDLPLNKAIKSYYEHQNFEEE